MLVSSPGTKRQRVGDAYRKPINMLAISAPSMRPSMLFISLLFLSSSVPMSGVAGAAVPDWVKPGMTATYDMYSSFIDANGNPNNAVYVIITMQAQSVSKDGVTGVTQTYNPHTGMSDTQQATCAEGAAPCVGRFWLDPANPTASIKTDSGATYTEVSQGPYSYGGRSWDDATMLEFQIPDSGVDFHLVYETKTGLILEYAIKYPSQQVYAFLTSVSGGEEDPDALAEDAY